MVQEEEKEQEIGKIFEKIMKENFPNLVKEINIQVEEAKRVKQDGCKEIHTKMIKMAKVKDTKRILKAALESM